MGWWGMLGDDDHILFRMVQGIPIDMNKAWAAHWCGKCYRPSPSSKCLYCNYNWTEQQLHDVEDYYLPSDIDLYIYLSKFVSRDSDREGNDFLGTWLKSADSFVKISNDLIAAIARHLFNNNNAETCPKWILEKHCQKSKSGIYTLKARPSINWSSVGTLLTDPVVKYCIYRHDKT